MWERTVLPPLADASRRLLELLSSLLSDAGHLQDGKRLAGKAESDCAPDAV
jgi:hypothetical protein